MLKSVRCNVEEMKVEECCRKHQMFVPIEHPLICQVKRIWIYKTNIFRNRTVVLLLTVLFMTLPVA
jgi:hypothetical protein